MAVPDPPLQSAEVAAACTALTAALPAEVDPSVARRPVTGDAARTAAWGDPPVSLECGVEPPERFEPPVVVNGVAWTVRDVGAGFRWTTSDRLVPVAVVVPDSYDGVEIVFPLSDAVSATLEVDPDAPDPNDPGPAAGVEPTP